MITQQQPTYAGINLAATQLKPESTAVLPTLSIFTSTADGQRKRLRFLLDTGAQVSLISRETLKTIGAKTLPNTTWLINASGDNSLSNSKTCIPLSSETRLIINDAKFCVVDTPPRIFQPKTIVPDAALPLSDPDFQTSGILDGIIGVDILQHLVTSMDFNIARPFIVIKTLVGNAIFGGINQKATPASAMTLSIDPMRFWALEEVPACGEYLSASEQAALDHIEKTIKSDENVFILHDLASNADHIPSTEWRHIPTELNPGDLASRGCDMQEFLEAKLWHHRPPLLNNPKNWESPLKSRCVAIQAVIKAEQLYGIWSKPLRKES